MAPTPLLLLQDITLTFGGTPLLAAPSSRVGPGERLCLVGRNGSGKSTLLKIAAGLVEPDGGERFLQPSATIRYLPQEPDLAGFATTLAYRRGRPRRRATIPTARAICSNSSASPARRIRARLSGGEARRAALARVLAPEPDILLLDEPTNHLDLPAIEWLEATLKGLRSAIVLISHDRRFLENLSRGDGLARPRRHAAARPRLRRLRGLARQGARGGGARPPQARPQDRRRGALAALRRHRAAQAQPGAASARFRISRSAAEGVPRATGRSATRRSPCRRRRPRASW